MSDAKLLGSKEIYKGRIIDVRLDTVACERDGIPVVRRPTGGRAVYHAQEVTYSFVARFEDLPVEPAVGDTYRFVAEALVQGLVSLGVAIEGLAGVVRPARRGERESGRHRESRVKSAGSAIV